MSETLQDLLDYDPIQAVEDLTRGGLMSQADRELLTLMFALEHNKRKDAALNALDDTTYSNDVQKYLRVLSELGLEQVAALPFTPVRGGYEREEGYKPRHETQYIFARRDGLLLMFDTFHETSVNSSKLYYAWQPTSESPHRVTSSGGWHCPTGWTDDHKVPADAVWVGEHDARVGLRHTLSGLQEGGRFISPWPVQNHARFIWCCHYGDLQNLSYGDEGYEPAIKAANQRVWNAMPDWVKAFTQHVPFSAGRNG
jgi:hypothetical protein